MSKTTPMEILKKANIAIQNGHSNQLLSFLESLANKAVLPDALQEKLDSLGDNPLDEKDLYDKLNSFESEVDKIDIVDDLLDRPDDYTAQDLAIFVHKVEMKITSYQNEDGTYKSTPNTKDAKLLTRKGYKKMIALLLTDGILTATTEQLQKAKPVGLKLSGLDEKKLDDWEKELVGFMMARSAIDTMMHSVGKQ